MGVNKNRRPTISQDSSGNYVDVAGGSGGLDWSTTEQDTGLKWHDDRAVYVKTTLIPSLSTGGTTTTTAHGIANLKNVVRIQGVLERSNGDFMDSNFGTGGGSVGIQVLVNASDIFINPGTFWKSTAALHPTDSLSNAAIAVYYTKTV